MCLDLSNWQSMVWGWIFDHHTGKLFWFLFDSSKRNHIALQSNGIACLSIEQLRLVLFFALFLFYFYLHFFARHFSVPFLLRLRNTWKPRKSRIGFTFQLDKYDVMQGVKAKTIYISYFCVGLTHVRKGSWLPPLQLWWWWPLAKFYSKSD